MNTDGLELKPKARYRQNSDVLNQRPTTESRLFIIHNPGFYPSVPIAGFNPVKMTIGMRFAIYPVSEKKTGLRINETCLKSDNKENPLIFHPPPLPTTARPCDPPSPPGPPEPGGQRAPSG